MMSIEQFNDFLNEIGGLVYNRRLKPLKYVSQNFCSCNEGWYDLITDLIRDLIKAGWTREINQIKEKFGGLCFYAEGLPENGFEIIRKYQTLALNTCEICGSQDQVRLCGHTWVKTLCENCAPRWMDRQYHKKTQ